MRTLVEMKVSGEFLATSASEFRMALLSSLCAQGDAKL